MPGASREAWHGLSIAAATRWAVLLALFMSTQYLVQPFVWTHWPVDDVLLGWVEVAAERVLMAMTIALALVLATRLPARRLPARTLLIAAASVAGAAIGQAILLATGLTAVRAEASAIFGSIAQWSGLALCVSGMYYLWESANEAAATTREHELSRSTAEALRAQAELQSLRNQIDPHFLFNTLATVRRLKETDHADGERLLGHLVRYLESTLQSGRPRTTVGDEIGLVASYLAIVAVRMSGRLAVDIDVPEDLRRCACPPLTLSTLVENAVKHGIAPCADGGTITVRARRQGTLLELCVEDTGAGMAAPEATLGGSGIGLANTRARLRALHGGAASLGIEANVPRGVKATIRLPAQEAAA
jgi:signal transduction histidine kinase